MALPTEVDVEGRLLEDGNIRLLGKATKQPNGEWHCLANYYGSLAKIVINVTFPPHLDPLWEVSHVMERAKRLELD